MEMQRLNTGMMERYEIENRRPARVNAVQFGMGEALLGALDRLLDDLNAALPAEHRLGIACAAAEADEAGYAEKLSGQDGMYTIVIRGYEGEAPVYREQVVQCILSARAPGEMDALAADAGLLLGIVDDTDGARALAARFARLRREAGLQEIPMLCLGGAPEGVVACRALADSLAFRAEPDEAAKLCTDMNYLDDMLYIAEPCARLTLCGVPDDLRARIAPRDVPGVRFTDAKGMDEALRLKAQVFDAGIFLMAAAGWLNGCDTLCDCMKHERLRRFVGDGFMREIIPALADVDRQAVERCVIESFERYENPLNRNRILRAAGDLIGRFTAGALPTVYRIDDERFEPPRRLAFALAATVMLYAGARKNPENGVYEVARGKRLEAIHDDPGILARFSTLSHDMDPESLAYAALADRELWGCDLREIDGLQARVALDIAAMQRDPGFLPEDE